MRIIGPNCLGRYGASGWALNATFAGTIATAPLYRISQSERRLVVYRDSRLESSRDGRIQRVCLHRSMLDVGWGDLIELLGDDPNTRAILMVHASRWAMRVDVPIGRRRGWRLYQNPSRHQSRPDRPGPRGAAIVHTGALTGSE